MFERPFETGQQLDPGLTGDLDYAPIGIQQQFLRPLDPHL
jgi:hypothetical protein